MVENCHCADGETIEAVFRTIVLLISSISTDQSQIYVKNVILAITEQGDCCGRTIDPLFVPSVMKTHTVNLDVRTMVSPIL